MPAIKEAEETVQLAGQRSRQRHSLLMPASLLALVCAAVAFTFFVAKDHGRPHLMIHDQKAPVDSRSPSVAVPKTAAPRPIPPATSTDSPTRTSFRLLKSAKPTALGPLRIRLSKTDPTAGTYDLVVFSGRRSFAHRRLHQNVTFSVSLGARKGSFRLVANTIDRKSIEGYWTVESSRSTGN